MQVYAQVQLLFKDAPDLLGEFKKFLPELMNVNNPGMDANFAGIMPAGVPPSGGAWANEAGASSSKGAGGSGNNRRRKREPVGKEPMALSKAEQARVRVLFIQLLSSFENTGTLMIKFINHARTGQPQETSHQQATTV